MICPFCITPCMREWCSYTEEAVKKQDMAGKIASVILNHNCEKMQIDRKLALQIAETILRLQEECGMLPPRIALPKLGAIDNAWETE